VASHSTTSAEMKTKLRGRRRRVPKVWRGKGVPSAGQAFLPPGERGEGSPRNPAEFWGRGLPGASRQERVSLRTIELNIVGRPKQKDRETGWRNFSGR